MLGPDLHAKLRARVLLVFDRKEKDEAVLTVHSPPVVDIVDANTTRFLLGHCHLACFVEATQFPPATTKGIVRTLPGECLLPRRATWELSMLHGG